jgi:DNA-binding LacI/PurR family transcriptional regulator
LSTSSDSTDAAASGPEAAASLDGASDATQAAVDGAADRAAARDAATSAADGAPEARRRTAVMADVARLAGVSHQTVSRVINDSAHVRPETRRRVLAAMRTLDYRPNPAARALVTGRSRTLGVVSFDTTLYGPASTLFAIEQAAHAAGYFITIVSLLAMDRAGVLGAVDRLRVQGVDGILVITPQEGAAEAVANLPAAVPVVAVEAGPAGSVPVVAVDQFAGAVSATQLLLDLGHRTVWHVAGPRDFLEAQQRVEGWRAALEAAGTQAPPVLTGDWSPRSGYEVGRRLAEDPEVTAVFVANDQMALGVLRALHERGRSIPREISVVGFDDIPEAQYFTPPLTTVRQDFGEMGRSSLRLLLDLMRNDQPPSRLTIAPELVVRRSTAPPPG